MLAPQWLSVLVTLVWLLAAPSGWAMATEAPTDVAAATPLTITETSQNIRLGDRLMVLEDPGGALMLEQVTRPTYANRFRHSTDTQPNFGITASAWWARIDLHNASSRTYWYLEQNDAMTREIDLWATIDGAEPIHLSGGSMRPVAARNVDALTHVFKLSLPANSRTTLYIRLKSDYVATFRLNLMSPEHFLLAQKNMNLLHGLYLGIMLSLVAYNGFLYAAIREAAYLYYTILMIGFTVFNTALNGQLACYVLPDWPWVVNLLMVTSLSIVPFLFTQFGRHFLGDDPPLVMLTLRITSIAGIASLLVAIYSLSWWTWISTLSATFVLSVFTGVLIHRINKGDKPALYFMLGVGWFILGGGALILGLLTVLPFEALSTEIGAGMQAIFLSLALAQRMRSLKDAKDTAHSQLQDKHAQLEATHKHLLQQEKMAQLGLLSAGVAHEINNPNNFVSISTQTLDHRLHELQVFIDELMGDDADDDIRQAFKTRFDGLFSQIELVKDGSQRITGIVNSMRAASRNDSGEMRPFDPAEGLLATVQLVSSTWKQKVRFDTQAVTARAHVMGHASQLNQVFTNLMVNACHAIEEKQTASGDTTPGVVSLSTRIDGDFIVIGIEDSGCGMPEHVRKRLFEPFFTTKGADRGTGLGMGICRAIIDEHRGRIDVDSTAGVGTTFRVFLPVTESLPQSAS